MGFRRPQPFVAVEQGFDHVGALLGGNAPGEQSLELPVQHRRLECVDMPLGREFAQRFTLQLKEGQSACLDVGAGADEQAEWRASPSQGPRRSLPQH